MGFGNTFPSLRKITKALSTQINEASSEIWMEGQIFLNSSKMGDLPRLTKRNFANHTQSICFWELPRRGRV